MNWLEAEKEAEPAGVMGVLPAHHRCRTGQQKQLRRLRNSAQEGPTHPCLGTWRPRRTSRLWLHVLPCPLHGPFLGLVPGVLSWQTPTYPSKPSLLMPSMGKLSSQLLSPLKFLTTTWCAPHSIALPGPLVPTTSALFPGEFSLDRPQ